MIFLVDFVCTQVLFYFILCFIRVQNSSVPLKKHLKALPPSTPSTSRNRYV